VDALFASGMVADLALLLLAAEAVALWALRRFAGRGPGLAPFAWFLVSGAALLLALRAALTGAGSGWVGAALAAAGVAQAMELRRRWRAPQR
jgi:hypothetical protein